MTWIACIHCGYSWAAHHNRSIGVKRDIPESEKAHGDHKYSFKDCPGWHGERPLNKKDKGVHDPRI